MSFVSLSKMIENCLLGEDLFKKILREDCRDRGVAEEESFKAMAHLYESMHEARDGYDGSLVSSSGLSGTDGAKLKTALEKGELYCGEFIGSVMVTAVQTAESNACMKRIVAAPTAGSCGVLPAVLLTCEEKKKYSAGKMVESLFVAAAIGDVIAHRASISGAMGGCQAEIGSASAMAAGAAVYLRGGAPEAIIHASALALKSLLGLSCDPVAGLVEVPCVKRNVIGAVNAVTAADMALAGVRSRIPPDEVVDAMRSIGDMLPACLKETGTGGLAATPSGEEFKLRLESL